MQNCKNKIINATAAPLNVELKNCGWSQTFSFLILIMGNITQNPFF